MWGWVQLSLGWILSYGKTEGGGVLEFFFSHVGPTKRLTGFYWGGALEHQNSNYPTKHNCQQNYPPKHLLQLWICEKPSLTIFFLKSCKDWAWHVINDSNLVNYEGSNINVNLVIEGYQKIKCNNAHYIQVFPLWVFKQMSPLLKNPIFSCIFGTLGDISNCWVLWW